MTPHHTDGTDLKLCIYPTWELRVSGVGVHLCPQEGLLMLALLAHPNASEILLSEVLWPDPDEMPDWWGTALDVIAHRLRQKLLPLGHTIISRAHYYRLEETREALAA